MNCLFRTARMAAFLTATSFIAACSTDAKGSATSGAERTGAGAPTREDSGGGDGGTKGRDNGEANRADGQPGGAGGGRQNPAITLAPTDVAVVARTMIEEGVALTGDLHPIETLEVRARVEGDLSGVYVREGQQVSAGQLLAQFESDEQVSSQRSAEADRAAARTDLANAQWTLEQDASLFKAGAIAERDYKNAEQTVAAARARLAAADARVRAAANQARDTRVLAPASGIIEKRLVEAGEHIDKGAPLFSVVQNGTLELAAAIPARQATSVRVGQPVVFVADGKQFTGRVARLSPTIDPVTRALTVYVQMPNARGEVRGGTFATGRVVSRTLTSVVAVPMAALRQSQDKGAPFVYRIDGKTVNVAPVQIGVVDERQGLVQITEGLQAGDRVIVGNVGILGRGMQITIVGEEKRRQRP